jgi:hypothetical protein
MRRSKTVATFIRRHFPSAYPQTRNEFSGDQPFRR